MAKIVVNRGYSSAREIEAAKVEHRETFSNFYDDDDRPLLSLRTAEIKTIEWEWEADAS